MEHSRSLNLQKKNVLQSLDCGRLPAGKTETHVCMCVLAVRLFPAVNLLVDYIPSSKVHKN